MPSSNLNWSGTKYLIKKYMYTLRILFLKIFLKFIFNFCYQEMFFISKLPIAYIYTCLSSVLIFNEKHFNTTTYIIISSWHTFFRLLYYILNPIQTSELLVFISKFLLISIRKRWDEPLTTDIKNVDVDDRHFHIFILWRNTLHTFNAQNDKNTLKCIFINMYI